MTSSRGQIHSTEIEACSSWRQLYLSRKLACANGRLHVCFLWWEIQGNGTRVGCTASASRRCPHVVLPCSVRENARPNSHTTTTLPTGVASTASSRRSHPAGLHLHRLIRNSAQQALTQEATITIISTSASGADRPAASTTIYMASVTYVHEAK